MIRILVYTQDVQFQYFLRPTLGQDFKVSVESDREAFNVLVLKQIFDVLIVDFDGDPDLRAYLTSLLSVSRELNIPILVMTDDEFRVTALDLLERGAYDYFRKPPVLPELRIIIKRAYEHAVLRKQVKASKLEPEVVTRYDRMVGSSAAARATYEMIRKVSNVNTNVLITGESGTGKELIARAIHNGSVRASRPFIAVSCGAIPETLVESELFGHEKGAFTGTIGSREGLFEQAADGTLFLDEIGELSLQTQVKLLRVLQERTFNRLGNNKLIPLKAKVLFATHRDLGRMVAEGTFRQDLYFRINVVKINSAALRDRTEDIPVLANHFLRHYSSLCEKAVERIDEEAMAMLLSYEWPGNIRELENVIQSAVIITESEIVSAEDLPEQVQQASLPEVVEMPTEGSFEHRLFQYKVKIATEALERFGGNKTLAARSLNISRTYMHRLIRQDPNSTSWESIAS